ncbi:MAG: hypothetical protein VB039_01205 [Oscillospiraceae bacterium]|nr:hypothetical protein [Oscillospiraceae bacterium]
MNAIQEKNTALDRISAVLKKIMICIFLLLVLFGMLAGVYKGLEHKSYLVAFAAAAVVAGGYLLLARKAEKRAFAIEHMGAVKTGAWLTAICLAVNFAWVLLVRVEPTVDYATFWITAKQLGSSQPLSLAEYIAMFPHILGYSTFLGLFVRLFGASSMLAPALNVVLTTASGLIIYSLCLDRGDLRKAAFAYLLWILCPSVTLYNTMVLSEPTYTCLILCFMLIVSRLERRIESGDFRWPGGCFAAALAGLVLSAVNVSRPIAAVLIIAFFIWLFLLRGEALRDGAQWRRWAAVTACLLAVYVASGKCWDAYAERVLGEKPAGIPGYSIYVGFDTDSWGSYSPADMDALVSYRYGPGGSAEYAQKQMLDDAKEHIASGEINIPKLFAIKLQTFLGNDEGGAYYSTASLTPAEYSLCALASNVFYYALVLLAALGTAREWKRGGRSSLLLTPLYVIGLTLAQMLVEVSGRYHYSIIPMLVIAAALSCRGAAAHTERGNNNAA